MVYEGSKMRYVMRGTKKTAEAENFSRFGAQSRARTGTSFEGHWILSPARLPIPPFGHRRLLLGAGLQSYAKIVILQIFPYLRVLF